MASIISNGRKMYRYSRKILRSPLTKTITIYPSANMLYDVGDVYVQNQPTRDFYEHTTGVYAINSGHRMRKAYLLRQLPQGAVQIWRYNTQFVNGYDTGYVFWNGNYSPGFGLTGGSAFMRIASYLYQIPEQYSDWNITNMSLTTSDTGTCMFSGRVGQVQTNSMRYPAHPWNIADTGILAANSTWRSRNRYLGLCVYDELTMQNTDPCTLYEYCQQDITLNMQNTDAVANTGVGYPMWETWPSRAVVYNDGIIPHARTNPHIQQHLGNADVVQQCNYLKNEGFWITLIPAVEDSGLDESHVSDYDYPEYQGPSSTSYYKDWWLSERVMQRSIDVTLTLDE